MEGLKLIDLGNEVSYIDVDTSKVPYTFSVKLGDRTFAFSIRYNVVILPFALPTDDHVARQ